MNVCSELEAAEFFPPKYFVNLFRPTVGTPNKGTPNKGIFPYLIQNLENGK